MGYAIQLVISIKYECVHVNPKLPIYALPHPSTQVTKSLFSTSVALFLFCKLIHCIISF